MSTPVDQVLAELKAEHTIGILLELVPRVTCLPGWTFTVRVGEGFLRLVIAHPCNDSYQPNASMVLSHWFPVPVATYNEKSWRRWIFECCRRVMNHELGEWFIVRGERPFAPLHGPGEDPYTIHEFRDEHDARMTQSGAMRRAGDTQELEPG